MGNILENISLKFLSSGLFLELGASLWLLRKIPMLSPGLRWFTVIFLRLLVGIKASYQHPLNTYIHHEPDYVRVTMICAIPDPENEHLFSGEGAEHGVWVPAQCCKGGQHSQLPPHGVFDKFNNIQFNFNIIQFNN